MGGFAYQAKIQTPHSSTVSQPVLVSLGDPCSIHHADIMTALPRALLVSSRANAIASSSRSVVPSLQSVSRRPSLPHRSPRVHFAFCKYASNSFGATSSSQPAHIPVIRSLAQLRRWRRMVRDQGLEVGVVPTVCLLILLSRAAGEPPIYLSPHTSGSREK